MTHQELEDKARQDKDSIETFKGFSVFLGVLLLLSILGNVVPVSYTHLTLPTSELV